MLGPFFRGRDSLFGGDVPRHGEIDRQYKWVRRKHITSYFAHGRSFAIYWVCINGPSSPKNANRRFINLRKCHKTFAKGQRSVGHGMTNEQDGKMPTGIFPNGPYRRIVLHA